MVGQFVLTATTSRRTAWTPPLLRQSRHAGVEHLERGEITSVRERGLDRAARPDRAGDMPGLGVAEGGLVGDVHADGRPFPVLAEPHAHVRQRHRLRIVELGPPVVLTGLPGGDLRRADRRRARRDPRRAIGDELSLQEADDNEPAKRDEAPEGGSSSLCSLLMG